MPGNYMYQKEVRLAIVMYGGVSLAIYMNGISREFFNLVRATAPANWEEASGEGLLRLSDDELTEVERVYRELGRRMLCPSARRDADAPVEVRFVVDILSGTSAGGINGLFLAKALANDESLDSLTNLWIKEAEISRLLNDERSLAGMSAAARLQPVQSLLNGDRHFELLLNAVSGMSATSAEVDADGILRGPESRDPKRAWVDRVDLAMTATDLKGLSLPLYVTHETIREKRHAAVFEFAYKRTPGENVFQNDFARRNSPFLTFVARCTSSIVPAFPTMRLGDVNRVRSDERLKEQFGLTLAEFPAVYGGFFRDYWMNSDVLGAIANATPQARANELARRQRAFLYRDFGDGGYLDNYPFGHAIDQLQRRRAELPVDRKLLFVEPDPSLIAEEEVSDEPDPRPTVIEHMLHSRPLRMDETIREDLDAIRAQNVLLLRVARIVERIEDGLAGQDLTVGGDQPGYLRLRISATTDDLADVLARSYGFERNTPNFRAMRYLAQAWREAQFAPARQATDFLCAFDFGYRFRRLHDLQMRLSSAILVAPREFRDDLIGLKKELNEQDRVLRGYSAELHDALRPISVGDGKIVTRDVANLLNQVDIPLAELSSIFASENEDVRGRRAKELLFGSVISTEHPLLQAGKRLEEHLISRLSSVDSATDEISARILVLVKSLVPEIEISDAPDAAVLRRTAKIRNLNSLFAQIDAVTYPMLYGTGALEAVHIDILRVSPVEATSLLPEGMTPAGKLAGTGMGHFSGFFNESWRREDILWGRLDAAERIVLALMPEGAAQCELLLRAQLAILSDTGVRDACSPEDLRRIDILCGNCVRKAVASFLDKVKEESIPLGEDGLWTYVQRASMDESLRKEFFRSRVALWFGGRPGEKELLRLWPYGAEPFMRRTLTDDETRSLLVRSTDVLRDMLDYLGGHQSSLGTISKLVARGANSAMEAAGQYFTVRSVWSAITHFFHREKEELPPALEPLVPWEGDIPFSGGF